MAEQKKVEVVPEVPNEEVKETPREIGYKLDGNFIVCTVSLSEPYIAIGIAYDFLCDIRDRLSMARRILQKQEQEKRSGDTLKKGAMQSKSFWNKHFK